MQIYPRYELRPRYKGEETVYRLLSGVKAGHSFAVHSVNLPVHEYKRWGEADFVMVSRSGLVLLEVKGGLVTLAGKEWRYQNARGEAIVSTEGPARQAMSAAAALEKTLGDLMHRKIRCRWGVVFPLCRFSRQIAELPRDRLADSDVCSSRIRFEAWLKALPFDQHQPSDFALSDADIEAVREVLVPEFSASTSLGLALRSNREEVIRLTDQQFAILESLDANPRLCVIGGAGTGKTELAALCARAERASGRNPAIVTRGRPLSRSLRSRLLPFGIPVEEDAVPDGTDVLIVDEGQDFAQPDELDALFSKVPGGVAKGRWRWFMDPNLQFMRRPPDPGSVALLQSNAAVVALTRNVRSTREIVGSIRATLNADVGVSEIDGFGIKVGLHATSGNPDELRTTMRLVSGMIEDSVLPSSIAVLGGAGADGPVCRHLLELADDWFMRLGPDGRIQSAAHGVVCGIGEFRGLEAYAVLLVDLNHLPGDPGGEAMLYIGMSRASGILHLMMQPAFEAVFKSLMKKSLREE